MLIEMGRLFEVVVVVVFSGLIGYLNLWPLYRKVVDVDIVVVVDVVRVQKSFKNTKTKLNWFFYISSQYFPT
jgi:hypothetical protein